MAQLSVTLCNAAAVPLTFTIIICGGTFVSSLVCTLGDIHLMGQINVQK